ncbi:MAG TPA: hypothetical protein VEW42_06230 [Candidatus Eisenbacteria bacterium]|nr:hypothetical protein [Candidatus Eisenbacteria bacterium]
MPYADKEKAKAYSHAYHVKTWNKRKARHKKLKNERRTLLANWLREYKSSLSCQKCYENHPACLDFHHIDAKTKDGTVANMVVEGYSKANILKEIKKCVILCRNCHAKEHYQLNNAGLAQW